MKASSTCEKSAAAFMSNKVTSNSGMKNVDFNCEQSFHNPYFSGVRDYNNKEKETFNGYELTFHSEQSETYKFHLKVMCTKGDEEKRATKDIVQIGENGEERYYTYYGPEGCAIADINPSAISQALSKFMGAIEIVLGLVLCFLGSKFIFYVIRFLIFIAVNAFTWLFCYNLNIVKFESGNKMVFVVAVVALVAGIAVAHYLGNFAERYGVAILSGFCGAAIAFVLLANLRINSVTKQTIMIITGIAFVYFGANYNKYVKSVGTACIGAFFFMHGIGQYAGGFPELMDDIQVGDVNYSMNNLKENPGYIGYIAGMFIFTCVGSFVQLKYIAPDDEDEDDIMGK